MKFVTIVFLSCCCVNQGVNERSLQSSSQAAPSIKHYIRPSCFIFVVNVK